MLSFMRKNAKSWIIKVLFGIIVVVFVFFYGFSDLRKSKETVLASIGEKKITVSEYQEAYKNMLQFYRNIYQGQLSEEMIKQMGLKQKALENLIDREIMLQEADRMKLYAAPGEISRNIMQSPVFQEKGVFSQALYERALRYYGISVADFEKNQERELIIKKLEDIVKSGVKVSDKELKEQFLVENEKIKIDYVCFNPETIKDSLPVSEQEIEGYYKKHSEEFRKPETVKAQYIVFSPQDYENKAVVSDKDIKEYYQTDIERFSEPKKIKARHILLKVGKGDASEKEQAIRKR
ncbi:MAG: SurA N-terminal domain-containing protein, partial [Proteobacteria bacterium]|nr:SurA N-terminal domain-containing protein [Pseudomonadota bacterium]